MRNLLPRSCCTFVGLLVTLDKRSADGNSTAYFWWVLSLSVLMEENSHSI